MTKLVSIVVPVHNSSKYLKRCLDSILNQTYKNIEVITVENGSTDDSLEILKSYEPQIKVIKLDSKSLGTARNSGINASLGDYISFIDSDDTIKKEFIEELVNSIEYEKSDLSICGIREIHEEKKEEIIRENFPHKNIGREEIKNNLAKFDYGPCNKLYKRDIIIKNKLTFPTNLKYEDVPFVLGYISSANKISRVSDALYNYHIHSKSEQTTVDERIFDIFEILELLKHHVNIILLEGLYTKILTIYSLKTKKLKDKTKRLEFIDKAYDLLDNTFDNWRECEYMLSRPFLKRIIQSHRKLVKLYTNL